ncbi:MAG: glycosyltransferase [Leptolyngbya sp. SIO1D8]|nr:glycosyltransferase [Leptolyngbya sp. SIO1D8]
MKILFLTTILLSKNCNGGEVASQCFVDALSELGHHVEVVGYLRKNDSLDSSNHKFNVVDERYIETRKASKLTLAAWYVLSLVKGLAYSAAKYYSNAYIKLVKALLKTGEYDIVIVDHAQLGWLLRCISDRHRIITIAHNVEQSIYQEIYQRSTHPIARWVYQREARLIKVSEDQLALTAQQVWTLTESDAAYFSGIAGLGKAKVFGLPPTSTATDKELPDKAFDVGLLGSWSWTANDEALQWFLKSVYPHLPADLSIHVAGKGADWLTDQYPNIHYRGVVPDAQVFLAEARVVAIPTLSGGGIQIKTLDAIASGSLIVATSVALRGIAKPPPMVAIAEQPREFADQLFKAVQMPSEQVAADAKAWYRDRQQKFLQDTHLAVNELYHHGTTSHPSPELVKKRT